MFLKVLDKHAPVKKKVVRANHAKYISKPLRKAIMKRSYLKKFILKNGQLSRWKDIRNKKTIAVDCIKKTEKTSLIALIPHLWMAINYLGKQLNLSFQTKEVLESKSNLLKMTNCCKMIETLLKKWTIFFKNAFLTLDIKENSYITNHNIPYIADPIEKVRKI